MLPSWEEGVVVFELGFKGSHTHNSGLSLLEYITVFLFKWRPGYHILSDLMNGTIYPW